MDDLEYTEFLEYPCRICGSVDYRYYGGGYNCREGHRNDELREQVGDEDDFDFSRSQMMRSTQLSQSKMTPKTARVASKKFRKRSGKGDHDVNHRYGVSEEEQAILFEEERLRFQRKGDKKKHVLMEAAMQILILQVEAVKTKFSNLWPKDSEICNEKKQEFEALARKLFQAYCNEQYFPYSHVDARHPELESIAPQFQPLKRFRKKQPIQQQQQRQKRLDMDESKDQMESDDNFDDLDQHVESSILKP